MIFQYPENTTTNKKMKKYFDLINKELNEINLDENIKTAYPTKNVRSRNNMDSHCLDDIEIEFENNIE